MKLQETQPDLPRAIELIEEVIEQLSAYLLTTTQDFDDLVANSCYEHECLREYDKLLEMYLSSNYVESELWQHISSLMVKVGMTLGDAMKNSINYLLLEPFARMIFVWRVPDTNQQNESWQINKKTQNRC